MEFCCEIMQRYVDEKNLCYEPQFRMVTFYIKSNDNGGYQPEYYRSPCAYCPYCGAKMPKILYGIDENGNDLYADALEETLGKEYCDITEDEIPEEFKTDEWWRKRGL